MNDTLKCLARCGAAVALLVVLPPLLHAQQSGPTTGSRGGRPDAIQLELRRQAEQEMIDRALAERPSPRRSSRPALAEFRADFLRLQTVNNDLMKASSGQQLDLTFIAKSAAEIRRLGQRLKANLVLPKIGESTQHSNAGEPGPDQLRSSVLKLDKLIEEFVSNPVFENAKVVDAELSAKARRNLDEIIALSGQLKKSGKRKEVTGKAP